MKLAEIAFFTDQVPQMSGFYRRLLGVEPVASSDKMSIFFLKETRIFSHYRYLAQHGELLAEDHHAFLVDSVDAACERMVQQGMSVEIPPQEYDWSFGLFAGPGWTSNRDHAKRKLTCRRRLLPCWMNLKRSECRLPTKKNTETERPNPRPC